MSTATWTEADEAVLSSVSRALRSRYHGFVDLDDVRQELYVWLIKNASKVEDWRKNYNPRTAERLLARSLRNHGEKFCRREKAAQCGYEVDDEFFYSISMVAELLQLYFDPDYMQPPSLEHDSTSGGKASAEGGNLVAMVSDVGRAFEELSQADQQTLDFVYGGEMAPRDAINLLALNWDCTYNAADKRIRRVVGRLREKLGGPRPYEETA